MRYPLLDIDLTLVRDIESNQSEHTFFTITTTSPMLFHNANKSYSLIQLPSPIPSHPIQFNLIKRQFSQKQSTNIYIYTCVSCPENKAVVKVVSCQVVRACSSHSG